MMNFNEAYEFSRNSIMLIKYDFIHSNFITKINLCKKNEEKAFLFHKL